MMIAFQHVYKSYGRGINNLVDATFQIKPGEFVFVSGPSGAGKSTLLKLMAGLDLPTRGTILVNGQNVGELPARSVPYLRRAIGTILQEVYLLNDRSAFDNVMLPMVVAGRARHASPGRGKDEVNAGGW